jgi:hypothetical protein
MLALQRSTTNQPRPTLRAPKESRKPAQSNAPRSKRAPQISPGQRPALQKSAANQPRATPRAPKERCKSAQANAPRSKGAPQTSPGQRPGCRPIAQRVLKERRISRNPPDNGSPAEAPQISPPPFHPLAPLAPLLAASAAPLRAALSRRLSRSARLVGTPPDENPQAPKIHADRNTTPLRVLRALSGSLHQPSRPSRRSGAPNHRPRKAQEPLTREVPTPNPRSSGIPTCSALQRSAANQMT